MDKSADFEISEELRQIAEENVGQARQACERLMGMASEVREQVARSQGELAASTLEIQSAALRFAEQNIALGFDFAARMARARNLEEYLRVQSEHADAQLDAVNRQTQELGLMWAQATERTAKAGG
ncbi:MAG: phasin family protein [Hyphomicrobiaceae bacterium]